MSERPIIRKYKRNEVVENGAELVYFDKLGLFEKTLDIVREVEASSFGVGRVVHVVSGHKKYDQYLSVYLNIGNLNVKVSGPVDDYRDILVQADWYMTLGKMDYKDVVKG